MEPEIEVLEDIPADLDFVDVMTNGSWVGVGGLPDAREVLFGRHVVRTGLACRFPLVCALDHETAVLVDARAPARRPNAWVVRADGVQMAEFARISTKDSETAFMACSCLIGRVNCNSTTRGTLPVPATYAIVTPWSRRAAVAFCCWFTPISRSRKLIWQQGHNRCGKRLTQCTVPGRLAPGAARSTSMGRMTTRRLFMLGGEATRKRNASRLLKYLCEA